MRSLFPAGSPGGPGGQGTDERRWPVPNTYVAFAVAVALGVAAVILMLRAVDGPDGHLHVYFLDIGQGDSTLIVTPSGRQVLVDGGPDGDVTSQELADVLPGGDRSLDLMVMTHIDSDHSHGLLEVLDRYDVGGVATGTWPAEGVPDGEWERRLQHQDLAQVEVSEGYRIQLDEDVTLEVLNPPADHPFGDSNNDSVGLRLTYGRVSVLLAADMEEEAERRLVNSRTELAGTVLKVGHHGSNTSSTQQFLDAVNPAIAVISAGTDNPYGHPAPEVLRRLEEAVGTENVYRTDAHGTVEVVSDGARFWVNKER